MLNLILLFMLLFAGWLLLIGSVNLFLVILGAVSCLAAVVFYRLIYKDKTSGIFVISLRMLGYLPWLFKEIFKSSYDISLRMWQLDPGISPQTAWLPTKMESDVGTTILANSITLTPGTVAIGTRDGMVHVHALTEKNMKDIKNGRMIMKVAKIIKLKG